VASKRQPLIEVSAADCTDGWGKRALVNFRQLSSIDVAAT
jgi:hypothetical protein